MRSRCNNPNVPNYNDYGGRGIKVCARWSRFENFIEDMGKRPSSKYTLERKDNDDDYGPENCFWATRLQQGNNKRNNLRVRAFGREQTVSQWAREVGCNEIMLRKRILRGWDPEEALTRPSASSPPLNGGRRRYAALKRATPKWITAEQRAQIAETYRKAKSRRMHVDHIFPLQGKLAWGLHVPWNLRALDPIENMRKKSTIPR